MGTSSFNKLATSTGTLLTSPTIVNGKRGKRGLDTTSFACTPVDTMDASFGFGFGIENPHQVLATYTEGNWGIENGSVIDVDGTEYIVKNIRIFPHFRKTDNTSYEIQIEINENLVRGKE